MPTRPMAGFPPSHASVTQGRRDSSLPGCPEPGHFWQNGGQDLTPFPFLSGPTIRRSEFKSFWISLKLNRRILLRPPAWRACLSDVLTDRGYFSSLFANSVDQAFQSKTIYL